MVYSTRINISAKISEKRERREKLRHHLSQGIAQRPNNRGGLLFGLEHLQEILKRKRGQQSAGTKKKKKKLPSARYPVYGEDLHNVREDHSKLVGSQKVALLELLHVNVSEHSQILDKNLL